jgi:hypothetical protein
LYVCAFFDFETGTTFLKVGNLFFSLRKTTTSKNVFFGQTKKKHVFLENIIALPEA